MTQTQVICHCGECVVKCNKHGKRATCADCGKRRMLGTAIRGGQISHLCDECCEKAHQKLMEPRAKNDWDEWKEDGEKEKH